MLIPNKLRSNQYAKRPDDIQSGRFAQIDIYMSLISYGSNPYLAGSLPTFADAISFGT